MNRFYYIGLFMLDGESEKLIRDINNKNAKTALKAGRECYHVFRRLKDLTGLMYTWSSTFSNSRDKPTVLGKQNMGSI